MTTDAKEYFQSRKGRWILWTGVLAGPILWFAHQQISFLLVPWVCGPGNMLALHAATFVMLLLTVGAGLMAYWSWKQVRDRGSRQEDDIPSRTLFMSVVGMTSSALFAIVILAQGLPNFFIDPCYA
ncbi:MAG: hypothetical protein ACK4UN_02990 [Limisphaerales bacterium]